MRLNTLSLSIAFLISFAAAPAVFAMPDIEYQVTVNTSSDQTGYGYIDFQFNPSSFTTQPANADVTNYAPAGALNPVDPNNDCCNNGDGPGVSGTLPGTVALTNTNTTNEYTEGTLFGTTITFDLDLSGPAISTPNGQGGGTFTLDFFDTNGNYLFTNDPQSDVPVFTVNINGDGTTTAQTYPSSNNGPPVVTYSGPILTVVPEPSSLLLLSGALLGIGFYGRKRLRSNS